MRTPFPRLALGLLSSAFLLAAAAPARAETVTYEADLYGKSEVPPTDSKGAGTVEATYDTASRKLKWTVTYIGLSGPATAAHFHGPAKPNENVGPVITLEKPLMSPAKGEAKLTEDQAKDLAAGLWYLNVHTELHPPGEIRGQLMKK
jgi:hypothetical protein